MNFKNFSRASLMAAAILSFANFGVAQQASLTLAGDARTGVCQNTSWSLNKTGQYVAGPVRGAAWVVTVTKGAVSNDASLKVNGLVAVTNSGSAPATIGNIVVNLQKQVKIGGKWYWKSAAADLQNSFAGDSATSANIVASASAETTAVNAGFNYTVNGAKGTFVKTAGSGSLTFADASSNSVFALNSGLTIPVGQTVNLQYSANFNYASAGVNVGDTVRAEVVVSFGNSGARGGSGASPTNIDISGDGILQADERNVRSVPSRTTLTTGFLPVNTSVMLADDSSSIGATGTVSFSNFVIDPAIANPLTDSATYNVAVDVTRGDNGGTITNTASLQGDTVYAIGLNTLPFCAGVSLQASAEVIVPAPTCGDDDFNGSCAPPPCDSCSPPPNSNPPACSYSKGGFSGRGAPAQLLAANWIGSLGGVTIGSNDGSGPLHNATWSANSTGLSTFKSFLNSNVGQGNPNGPLTADSTNPTSTAGGQLARQAAALNANVSLNINGYAALRLNGTGTSLDGMTIAQIAAVMNGALASSANLPSGFSYSDLNALATNLNVSYDQVDSSGQCVADSWAVDHLIQ